jgi:glutamate-1-semialdehyde 2,1-aminomutase
MPAGVPEAVRRQVLKFHYNDLPSLRALFDAHPGRIACVIMEAMRTEPPQEGFLHAVQRLCREHGALFILDEMITGFRLNLHGAQGLFELEPDLSCFGKALGNGFAISALVGRREVMRLGGLDHDGERVFLLSTTHGAETHALAAAIETMRAYRERDVIGAMARAGARLLGGVRESIRRHGIDGYFDVIGHPSNLIYVARDAKREPSQEFRTLFLQETVRRGLLMPSMVVSAAHGDAEIDHTVGAVDAALAVYARALEDGVGAFLEGRPVKPVFRRYV